MTACSKVVRDRAARDLGWRPQTVLADGIRSVYQWIAGGAPDRAAS
jgi:nucleoside-diphosphate-sugar epimerase